MQSRQSKEKWFAGLLLGGSFLLAPAVALGAESAAKPDPETALRDTLISRCEKRWTRNFVPMAKAKLPANDPVNDESRQVVLELVADRKGKVISVDVTTPSGADGLDQAAKDIAFDTGPLPKVDAKLLSDDGNVHAVWVFARKDGSCSDLQVRDVQLPVEQAVPALLSQGRDARAFERLTQALADGNDKALSAFGQHWLLRTAASKDKNLGLTATGALAAAGNREATAQLAALAEADRLPSALWPQLARSGKSVCPLAKKALADKNVDARFAALRALAVSFDKACVGVVAAVAVNQAAPADERILALVALAKTDAEEARVGSKKAMDDGQPKVRAAAIRSWAQPDRGLRALYGLTAIMKEPNVVVRAAINAGIVRSSGDKGIEQLYLVFKEKDPQIYEALAEELGQMSTEASAEMLRRFSKKDDARIKRAVGIALGRRSDRFARAASAPFAAEGDASLKLLASHAMTAEDIDAAVAGVDPKNAGWVYETLLQAGLRGPAAKLTLATWNSMNDHARVEWASSWLRGADAGMKVALRP